MHWKLPFPGWVLDGYYHPFKTFRILFSIPGIGLPRNWAGSMPECLGVLAQLVKRAAHVCIIGCDMRVNHGCFDILVAQ